jgi:hypothetical protein
MKRSLAENFQPTISKFRSTRNNKKLLSSIQGLTKIRLRPLAAGAGVAPLPVRKIDRAPHRYRRYFRKNSLE